RVSLSGATQAILDELHDYVHQEIDVDQIQIAEPSIEPAVQHAVVAVSDINAVETDNHYVLTQISLEKQNIDSAQSQREFDADVLDIFIEEADELLVGMDHDLNTWSSHPDATTALNNLMRYLHTLKGGANMVQATHIGLIAHELETIYERVIKGQ
ncbi:Hpt domain-containing protein, partial [Enterococcus casseliflavus]|nr:Hpt domain-containing protein [Enterococcus casseliflavus]